jgi:ribosome recycling factor
MYNQLIDKERGEFEKSIEYFKDEIARIRTGRASSALVENLSVDYYGAKSPMKQVASISVPEPRQIVIAPWDKDNLISIEKSIRESDLNLNPINDGQVIRINIPQLNEERRKELVKLLNQKAEEGRVSVRKRREDIWDLIQDLTRDGKISEDDKFQGKEKLQKVVDEYNNKIEEIRKNKEDEIMTI